MAHSIHSDPGLIGWIPINRLVMNDPFLLSVIELEKTASLRERMLKAGCVFEFVVFEPIAEVVVDEHLHRQALLGMGHYFGVAYKNPELARSGGYLPGVYNPDPELDTDIERAVATQLSPDEILNLTVVQDCKQGPLELYEAFCNPPHRARFKGGEAESQSVFGEWLQLLGIELQDDIVVINWVSNYETKWMTYDGNPPVELPWDDYFSFGLEWWGIWCLTVWNPKKRTLSVLTASTSD